MAMYANELEERVARLDIQADNLTLGGKSIPVVDAIATVDKAGMNWSIALVNRHPDTDVDCTVMMKDIPLDGEYKAIVLAGDSPDAFNDIEKPDRVVPEKTKLTFLKGVVTLPPHSLTIVKVTLKRRHSK
jgi:alpha-N-arabinofuranosidase